jgi:hypothetical protein
MMLDVSDDTTLEDKSFDSWLGDSSSFNGRISESTCVGLVVVEFKCWFGEEVRRMFSRTLHILGFPFRDEPFMKETLYSRAISRESLTWGCGLSVGGGRGISGVYGDSGIGGKGDAWSVGLGVGKGRESTRCWISLARIVGSGSDSLGSFWLEVSPTDGTDTVDE